ncbi:MAG: type IV secretory system conjugative DNA transfer family protein [Cupriavidus sp.]|nr:MAG: type IV secretory system conjugative DNA transfer family protein [Cupriavidus sp.]
MSDRGLPPAVPWSTGRRIAAAVFALAGYAVLCGLALHLAGVLFLLLCKANPAQARFGSVVHYWRLYSDDARLRLRLITSAGLSGGGLLVVLPTALVLAARPRRRLHGDARFASAAEILDAFRPAPGQAGILVGKWRGRFLSLPGQLSVLLSAPTRSGKGVGVVIPNLLNWPDSVVVLDIKGENYEITAGFRAACGQAVYAFSPFDEEGRTHRWNPLGSVRAHPLHRTGDLLAISQVLFPSDGGATSSEAFFNDQARNLFLGLGLLLLESPRLPRTIGEMLRQASGQGRPLREHLAGLMQSRSEQGRPLSAECADALQRLLSNSDNTMSSIVATFVAPLVIFADTTVDAATSADDFQLEDVRRRRMSIYVRIPPNRLASARPLLSLFFSQLVNLNTRYLPAQDPTLRHQCLIVNDEFPAMGRVPSITTAAAFLAGYDLRLLTVIQAMSQLDAVYGDRDARTFATNHGLQILFAPREQRDADEYSAMLGHFTERASSQGRSRTFSGQGSTTVSRNDSEQRRALLLPQEFKELGRDRLVLILENCKPILADKIRYFDDPALRHRLLRAPEVPAMNLQLHIARVQGRWQEASEDLAPDQRLDIHQLAHDLDRLPDDLQGSAEAIAETLLSFFSDEPLSWASEGGEIEPAPDVDGVLMEQTEHRGADVAPQPLPA